MPDLPLKRIKLIYNPSAGRSESNPSLLKDLLGLLQMQRFLPEVHIVQADDNIDSVLEEAYKRRHRFFVICGGDGTIESAAAWLAGRKATLGIIPGGTRNNVALSLGIPGDLFDAVKLLRSGTPTRIDLGWARCGKKEAPFLEACSVGLISALLGSADQLQKGNLTGLGDIFSTLATFPTAAIQLSLDHQTAAEMNANAVLVANLSFFGFNYRLTSDDSPFDNLLEVLVFRQYSNLELVGTILQNSTDDRIARFHARQIEITATPAMPVYADGQQLGNTPVSISIQHKALTVISGRPATGKARTSFLENLNPFRLFRK